MMKFYHGKVHTYELRSIGILVRIILEGQGAVTRDGTEKSRAKWGTAGVIKLVETSPGNTLLTDLFQNESKSSPCVYTCPHP